MIKIMAFGDTIAIHTSHKRPSWVPGDAMGYMEVKETSVRIWVSSNLPKDIKRNVWLHECGHLLDFVNQQRYNGEHERDPSDDDFANMWVMTKMELDKAEQWLTK